MLLPGRRATASSYKRWASALKGHLYPSRTQDLSDLEKKFEQ